MGDMGVLFNSHKEQRKIQKEKNLDRSTKLLIDKGVEFESKNGGIHLIITHKEGIFDFWPSTGKYKKRSRKQYNRGVFKLLGELGL